MATYTYKAKKTSGKKVKTVKGEVNLPNEAEVNTYLTSKGLTPVSIRKKSALDMDLSDIPLFADKIKQTDINFFCKQFASMIQAGVNITRALEICAQQTQNKTLKKHLNNINLEVNRGKTLSQACKEENIFPDILCSMIECGEESGNLDKVLNQMVQHFDTQAGTMRKLKKALSYPAMVFVAIIVVVIIMMVKVIPAYASMFMDSGVELPVPTKIVMAASDFMVAYAVPIVLIFVGILAFALNIRKVKKAKVFLDNCLIKMPLFGDLTKKSIAATFTKTMAMLISSGLPMLQAMNITKRVVTNEIAVAEFESAIEDLKHGHSLYDALQGSEILPQLVFQMISIGEETGALDEMLTKIGVYYDEEVSTSTDSLMQLIEPALTIFMAAIIGTIMLAIMLPTFTMASAMM